MGIWIRSQLRKGLCIAQRFYIYEKENKWRIVNIVNGETDDFDTLGIYDTEERALEVLDEIQSIAIEGNPPKDNESLFYDKCKVFEMPEK